MILVTGHNEGMSMSTKNAAPSAHSVLLVGAGQMAIDYTKVLTELGVTPLVLGRGKESANRFFEATGVCAATGKLEEQLAAAQDLPQTAIVTVNAHQLTPVTETLLRHNIQRILVEKPAALDLEEANRLLVAATSTGAEVYVAYNRRFLASVIAAQDIIAADGGAISVKFDFSEPARRIATLNKPDRELKTWFYGNSTHVLDLAFYLSGSPVQVSGDVTGGSVIDPETGIFTGHGLGQDGCHISWHANWVAPGRWGVEVLTRENRLILQPLEKLRKQSHEGFAEKEHPINDTDDQNFKPGLLKQTRAFLTGEGGERLLPLNEHVRLMQAYEAIRTGDNWHADK